MTTRLVSADQVLAPGLDGAVGIVIRDGMIDAVVGPEHPLSPDIHHEGASILPRLMDSHFHPLGYAALMAGTSLMPATDIDDLVEILAGAASRTSAGAVVAQRFDDTRLGRMPTRADLDRAVPDRPALAYRYCGHVAVANSAALTLAGVDRETHDPKGGSIERDRDGSPTGVLRETATDLVGGAIDHLVPPPTDEETCAAIDGLRSLGLGRLTGIVVADVPLWCGVGAELEGLCRIARDLTIDIDVLVIADRPGQLREAAGAIDAAGGRLTFLGWKDFADGSLGGHTAAMHEPFLDVDTRGTLRLDPSRADEMARTALDLGGMAAIHAIGDRAVDEVLTVYERLLTRGADPGKLRVEHASVVSDTAIERLAGTGVVASVQPSFLTSEAGWVPARLGPDRPAYRFAAMSQAGVRMVGGSDCPVERPDPLAGVAAAIQRPGWSDDQHLDPATALDLFTGAPARLLGLPRPLSPGSVADFLVVEGDIGSPGARLVAVYERGESLPLGVVPWPG